MRRPRFFVKEAHERTKGAATATESSAILPAAILQQALGLDGPLTRRCRSVRSQLGAA